LNAIPDLMFLQTRDGVYLDYHAANPKDLLAPPEAFIGRNMREILPPDLADQFASCFERAEELGEPQLLEYQLTLNETDRWFEARIVRSGENVLTVVRDITQRVFIEEAIKRNEAQLAGIISSAMDGIITVDEDQRIMLFNAAAEKIFGCSPAEAMGQSLERFIPERSRLVESESVRGFDKSNGTPFLTGHLSDLSGRKASGEVFPLEASISQVGLNGQKFYTVILRDITERKKAVDELLQSEQRFSKAFRANPQPMSLTTMVDGRYIDVNDSFLAMSGYAREEVIGRTSLELAVWETPQHRSDFIKRLQDEGSVVNVETKFRTRNGFLRFLLSSAERLEIAGAECLLVASSDITERKQAEEALVRAHEELLVAHEEVNRLKNQLEAENIYLQQELQLDQTFGEMVGQSDALKYVLFKISQVALTDSTVLITGETGTGKELVARAIHNASLRKDRPLIRVNCAALPASLIESELFGYEKGAFTGALSRKLGRFELANGSTIFLDEIGDLPLESQVKLLRAVQEGEIERLGGTKTIKIDVRIIAATNRNLKQEIEKGTFREDLWYRLNVFPITVPPLRQRKDDIPPLTEYFASKSAKKFGKKIESVSAATMHSLQEHSWPGNVRELENVIERAVIHSQGNVLHLSERFETPPEPVAPDTKSLEQMEREYIMRILESTGGRIEGPNGAAKILGLNPSTLRTRIGKLGIQKQSFSAAK
ncbi:MAG TPA: sigma 54-interacting transcriptional regulator, partial [Pyrinomonadaceae bacterium]|nr:sigma 54-interacting transcriptional regulator [Pyrinomonadaceae bacterium]